MAWIQEEIPLKYLKTKHHNINKIQILKDLFFENMEKQQEDFT